jgi:hypothetical protein
MIPLGLAEVDAWWPYAVFAPVGAVGGALGGWAVEQNVTAAEPSLYMLAGGLALVIPTVIVTLDATTRAHFDDEADPSSLTVNPSAEGTLPGEGASPQDGGVPGAAPSATQPPATQPAAPAPGAPQLGPAPTSDARRPRKRAPMPVAAFDVYRGSMRIGLPAVQIRNRFSVDEVQQFGAEPTSEYLIPLVKSTF